MRARFTLTRLVLATSISALAALHIPSAQAATFTWVTGSNFWSVPAAWTPAGAPLGTNPADILVFAGDIGTSPYVSDNNIAAFPFLLNRINLNATYLNPPLPPTPPSEATHRISGNQLFFSNPSPVVVQSGVGGVSFSTPIKIEGTWSLAGTGTGIVTFNEGISGIANITKSGTSTYRFGTNPLFGVAPSNNTWLGRLTINEGTFRFNNNAESGRTAVRANPVTVSPAGASVATFSCNSEMRFGTLNGTAGATVQTVILDPNSTGSVANESILITAFTDGTYLGKFNVAAPIGGGNHRGELLIRGTATQTLSGPTFVDEDTIIGRGATLVIAGTASLASNNGADPAIEPSGSVILSGGTLRLENQTVNNNNRIREGGLVPDLSTTVQPVGGGKFILSGNSTGTQETTGRLQLGASGAQGSRAGHLDIEIVHRAGSTAVTSLGFQSYSRSQLTVPQFATVAFSANNGATTPQFLQLGEGGNAPAIFLTENAATAPVPLLNGLLNVTGGPDSGGWATISSPGADPTTPVIDFATYNTETGIAPLGTVPWSQTLAAPDNALLTSSQATPGTALDFALNSLKIAPAGLSQVLTIAGSGNLKTSAFLHTGASDYTIRSTGGGGIGGTAPRYFHVEKATLNISASVAPGGQPIVKSGAGVLSLTNTANTDLTNTVVVNAGTLRATPASTLPAGELRLRGGVLEVVGGSFARTIGRGANTVNFSGISEDAIPVAEGSDRGSGGFAASGTDATVTLNGNPDTLINWEDLGFVRSGHALILGSPTADAVVDFKNPINLTPLDNSEPNYNAREIRAVDNPVITSDHSIISGVIYGSLQQDLLKTGSGALELTAVNAYIGHTQVREGRLLVTGSIASSNAAVVAGTGVLGGTGTVGTVLLDGGTLEPGKNGIGTLTTGAIYWRSGKMKMDLGSGTSSDSLALGSNRLIKEATNTTGPYQFDFGGTGEGGRTYVLAKFSSTNFVLPAPGGQTSLTHIGLRPGLTGTLSIDTPSGEIRLSTNLPKAQFATQPQSQRENIGGEVTFTVETTLPGAYTYKWFKGAAELVGETLPTLTLTGIDTDDAGDYKVVVSNGNVAENSTSAIAVLTVNQAPVATPPAQPVAASEDTAIDVPLTATDPNAGDTLTYSLNPLALPLHGTLSGTAPNFVYTPAANYNGPDSFEYRVSDGLIASAYVVFNINVAPVNDAPNAVEDTAVVGIAKDLIANDTDIEGDTLTLTGVQNGAFGTVVRSGNSATYTAGPAFARSDTYTYTVSDGNGGSTTGSVTVRLENPISLGITAKGMEISGEPASTVLASASQPSLNEDGLLAFVGTYTKPDRKSQNALFIGNPPLPVVKTGITTAPDSTLTFAKLSAPVINASGDVGFKGSLTKAPAGTADGIWVRNNAGTIRRVAQGKMAVPGISGASFSKFGDIALPSDGRLIFSATIKGVAGTADTGIWRETATGSLSPVVREGDIIDNQTPGNGLSSHFISAIAAFGPSEKTTLGQRRGFNDSGDVVARVSYKDKSSAIIRFNNDGSKAIVWQTAKTITEAGNAQIKSFGLPVIADDGTVSVLATLTAKTGTPTPATAANDTVILRRTLAGVTTLVAQEGSAAVNIANSSYKAFSYPVGTTSSRIGFIGTLKAKAGGVLATDDVGIWRHNAAGTLAQVAREGQPAPVSGSDTRPVNFSTFKSLAWAGTGDAGIAFIGTVKGATKGITSKANDTGLWVEDSDSQLKLAFRTGQPVSFGVNQKTVKSFTVLGPVLGALGQGGSTNQVGGFGIFATFTDRTTGIVTVWVP